MTKLHITPYHTSYLYKILALGGQWGQSFISFPVSFGILGFQDDETGIDIGAMLQDEKSILACCCIAWDSCVEFQSVVLWPDKQI